jgi:putative transposase
MMATKELSQDVGVRQACAALGVARATFYRQHDGHAQSKPEPPGQMRSPRALSNQERDAVRRLLNSERFQDRALREVYAAELDAGRYHCSVRTMYRILEADESSRERRKQLSHPQYKKPQLLATRPNQVWSWDITKLLGPQKWTYYYLYVILDIFSRYVVGWMLAHRESADLARRLILETVLKQQVVAEQLTIHSDRGPSMTSQGVAQLLASLGVTKSHSRPQVSNDNPFSESQFKTMKYWPEFPDRFDGFEHAHGFCRRFLPWYNDEHYHSGIGLVTPAMLHYGAAERVRDERQQTLSAAYNRHPERFVQGLPAPPALPTAVWINPPSRDNVVSVVHETAVVAAQEKRLPEAHCPQKPEALFAHPWSGYPSLSCVPAELNSVSADGCENTPAAAPLQHTLDTLAMPEKILGVWGPAPREQEIIPHSEQLLH